MAELIHQKPPSLNLSLPTELRYIVLNFLFTNKEVVRYTPQAPWRPPPITQACRSLRHEALSIYLSKRFHIVFHQFMIRPYLQFMRWITTGLYLPQHLAYRKVSSPPQFIGIADLDDEVEKFFTDEDGLDMSNGIVNLIDWLKLAYEDVAPTPAHCMAGRFAIQINPIADDSLEHFNESWFPTAHYLFSIVETFRRCRQNTDATENTFDNFQDLVCKMLSESDFLYPGDSTKFSPSYFNMFFEEAMGRAEVTRSMATLEKK